VGSEKFSATEGRDFEGGGRLREGGLPEAGWLTWESRSINRVSSESKGGWGLSSNSVLKDWSGVMTLYVSRAKNRPYP